MNARQVIHKIFREESAKPLDWENGGCLSFPGKVAKALTGKDPTEPFRSKFSTEQDAKRFLIGKGRKSLSDLVAETYAMIPVAMARPGDWVVVVNEDGTDTLGVVTGSRVAATTAKGIGTVPLSRAKSAYRVE